MLVSKGCGQLQPHVVVVAEDHRLKNATVYAVIQGNLFFAVDTVFEAVAMCMKACFVFNLSYPLPARSAWTFIQKAGFNITTNDDLKSNKLMELLTLVTDDE
jgi:hypothetical protein